MSARRRLLLVFVCAVGMLMVAATFPAADPRLDAPGSEGSAGTVGDWESVTGTPEQANEAAHEQENETEREREDDPRVEITPIVEGDIIPGTTAYVGVNPNELAESEHRHVRILVDGESMGTIRDDDRVPFRVPEGTEPLNVTVEETGDSIEVPVETEIGITLRGPAIPGAMMDIQGTIGEYDVSDATVFVDGEEAATTNDDGIAAVELPDTAGETEISLQRDEISGSYTAKVAEPEIGFSSPLTFPGMPAHVTVTADGAGVDDATVELGDGSETTTDSSGGTWVRVPVSDEITVTGTVGAEEASTTVSNLYLRTTLIVLVLPGLLIGATWTYLRYAPHRRRTGFSGAILSLAGLLGGLSTAVTAGLTAVLDSARSIRFSRLSVPAVGLSLSAIAGAVSKMPSPSLRFPSFEGLFDSLTWSQPSSDGNLASTITEALSTSDEATNEDETDSVTEEAAETEESTVGETETLPDRREQLRESWHTFLDHVGVRNRETWTPGEASRYALAAGYPRESVRRLLALFRDAEYGDTEPSTEDVTEARAAVDTLAQHDPEEDSK